MYVHTCTRVCHMCVHIYTKCHIVYMCLHICVYMYEHICTLIKFISIFGVSCFLLKDFSLTISNVHVIYLSIIWSSSHLTRSAKIARVTNTWWTSNCSLMREWNYRKEVTIVNWLYMFEHYWLHMCDFLYKMSKDEYVHYFLVIRAHKH